jgi:hypothetical protein
VYRSVMEELLKCVRHLTGHRCHRCNAVYGIEKGPKLRSQVYEPVVDIDVKNTEQTGNQGTCGNRFYLSISLYVENPPTIPIVTRTATIEENQAKPSTFWPGT